MNLTSADYTLLNYGVVVYFKSALAYNYLFEYLGEDEFNRIMQKFFREWQFRHPGPEDLRQAFEKESGKDLSWFFTDIVSTKKTIDYSIHRYSKNKVLVKNNGSDLLTGIFIRHFGWPEIICLVSRFFRKTMAGCSGKGTR